MQYVLGIDGGGTSTRAVCAGPDGRVLGGGRAGPSNYLRVGLEQALESVRLAAQQAVAHAGVELPGAAAAVCLAGLGRENDRAQVVPRLEALGLAGRLVAATDAEAALVGAHPEGPGVVLIAGTGAVAWGRGSGGEVIRADGWGPLLGDEGSGYWIGREALKAVVRAQDGRGPRTALTEAVLTHLGVTEVPHLVGRLPLDRTNSEDVSGLAVVCADVAREGDAVARGILWEAGERLGQAASAAAARVGPEPGAPCRVALAGSVPQNGLVREALERTLRENAPGAAVTDPRLPPVLGAVLMALEAAGAPADAAVIERLESASREHPAGW